MRLTSRSPLASLGSFAALSLALSACADPLSPSVDASLTPAPNFDVGMAATTTLSSGDYTVLVCPEATAFDANNNTGCYEAFEVGTNPRWAIIPGTSWISNNPDGNQFYSTPQQNYFYKVVFNLPAGSTGASLDFDVFSDNAATLYLNNNLIGSQPQGDVYPNYGCLAPTTPANACTLFGDPTNFTTSSYFQSGTNVLTIKVLNATYQEGCATAAPGDPLCESATGVNFTAIVNYTTPGNEGCTPGYWKQSHHFDSWMGYAPGDAITSLFPAGGSGTLLDALQGGGGKGLAGAKSILLRAAVAAVLNASSSDVAYTMSVAEIQADVAAAIASNDRETMLELAAELDADNNLGCPLN